MKIISTNIDTNDKKAIYRLTRSGGVNVKDVEPGVSKGVKSYALYTESKEGKDGQPFDQQILAIVTDDGDKLVTISQTFIRDFLDILELMEGEPFAILTRKDKTKAGREFVYCELDCN